MVDGRRVEIVIDRIDALGEPAVARGAWRDPIDPIGRAAPRRDPGKAHAFEVSTLEITRLAVDDHAAALGTVVARDPAGNPTRIAATAIARGARADALIDEIDQASPDRIASREAQDGVARAARRPAALLARHDVRAARARAPRASPTQVSGNIFAHSAR